MMGNYDGEVWAKIGIYILHILARIINKKKYTGLYRDDWLIILEIVPNTDKKNQITNFFK